MDGCFLRGLLGNNRLIFVSKENQRFVVWGGFRFPNFFNESSTKTESYAFLRVISPVTVFDTTERTFFVPKWYNYNSDILVIIRNQIYFSNNRLDPPSSGTSPSR